MTSNLRKGLVALMAVAAMAGCSGKNGKNGTDGATGATGQPGGDFRPPMTAETCSYCHSAGAIADNSTFHDNASAAALAKGTITILTADFTDSGTVKPTITFQYRDHNNALAPEWRSFNFTVAQLVPATTTVPEYWSAFVWRTRTGYPNGTPNSEIGGDPTSTTSPKGTLTYNSTNSTYTYVFATDLKAPGTAPAIAGLAPTYSVSATIRIGIQVGSNSAVTTVTDYANGVADFVPNSGAGPLTPNVTLARDIVATTACNVCHGRMAFHGRRVETAYCTTCHNYQLTDAAGLSGDLGQFIHKIHGREKLASPTTPIFTGIIPEEITYPQGINNCATCHTGPAGARWNTNPSRYACTACHDTTAFTSPPPTGMTLHTAGVQADDSACSGCHTPTTIQNQHKNLPYEESKKYLASIGTVSYTTATSTLSVAFSIVDPTNANTPYALTDAPFTQTGGASRLALDIDFANAEFTNDGNGVNYGQPLSINLLSLPANATLAGPAAGVYTLTVTTALPAGATGSGTVALEGHPGFDPGTGVTAIPMKSVSKAFAITGTSATARRSVVSMTKCNACHFNLSLHGGNRTSDLNLCLGCHNTEATDGSRRPASGAIDGKVSEGIDFKYLIHKIHGNKGPVGGEGIVVYGFGGSVNDFRTVAYPNVLANCQACHVAGAYQEPNAAARGTTTDAGADKAATADNLRTTKYLATCGGCHGTGTMTSHMEQMGGTTGVTQAQIDAVQ
jgi:OmcA/MtrC family decaheme c-type cytochrome